MEKPSIFHGQFPAAPPSFRSGLRPCRHEVLELLNGPIPVDLGLPHYWQIDLQFMRSKSPLNTHKSHQITLKSACCMVKSPSNHIKSPCSIDISPWNHPLTAPVAIFDSPQSWSFCPSRRAVPLLPWPSVLRRGDLPGESDGRFMFDHFWMVYNSLNPRIHLVYNPTIAKWTFAQVNSAVDARYIEVVQWGYKSTYNWGSTLTN